LLEQALTHRSHGPQNNERLEFLGDGVLGCAVAEELYGRFPGLPEGNLTRLRAGLVREEALAEVGERLGLRELLRVETGTPVTTSVLADAMEALFGAVFLDSGYTAARATVVAALGPLLEGLDSAGPAKDAKTELQEALQARRRQLPKYRIVTVSGAAHQQSFEVECALPELGLSTSGSGTTLKRAEQQAAQAMLERLGRLGS
jgi:ribonuclease-3